MTLTKDQKTALENRDNLEPLLNILEGMKIKAAPWAPSSSVARSFEMFPVDMIHRPLNPDLPDEPEFEMSAEAMRAAWPLNVSILSLTQGVTIQAVRTVGMKDVRGRIIRPYPKMLEHHVISSDDGKEAITWGSIYRVTPSWQIEDNTNGSFPNHRFDGYHQGLVELAAGFQIAREYNWHVVVGGENSRTPLRIPTTPKGARSFLSLRDIDPGKKRRSSLKHWVEGHLRELPVSAKKDYTWVKDHMRGKTHFSWGDLKGWIEPSQYDIRRLELGLGKEDK